MARKSLSDQDLDNNKIINLADPANDQDAATKKYVDDNSGGSGDVVGPSGATDNTIARFDGATGKLIQDSGVTIDDSGNLVAPSITAMLSMNVDGQPVATMNNTLTMQNKTLITPTIASFVNATHNHQDAAGGGQLSITAATTGTLPVNRGGTGATTLTSGNVLVGAGTSAVTTTKAAPSGNFVGTSDVQTLSNKIIQKRTSSATTVTSPFTPNFNTAEVFYITLQGSNLTLNAPSNMSAGDTIQIVLSDDGVARTLTFNASYKFAIGNTAPTTTSVPNKIELVVNYDGTDYLTTWSEYVR